MDMSTLKKQTPGQKIHRLELILETIRSNQEVVAKILSDINFWVSPNEAIKELQAMHKQDRDVLLWDCGIFTPAQLKELRDE